MACENNGLIERLQKRLEYYKDDLDTWTDSLVDLSEIEDAFKRDGKPKLDGKTILDIGTDCVKPLYIALKFNPKKIVGINEEFPYSYTSDIEQKSKLFTGTEIKFYDCSFFDKETLDRILRKEKIKKFNFVLVSKTLHHLRTEECVEEHACSENEECCKYGFDEQYVFEKLLGLGERVIIYETYFPQEEDEDKVRGRGGYFTTNEWKEILTSISISEKYKARFITPMECPLTNKELENIIAKLRQVDCICFYVERQDIRNSKRLIAKTKR